MSTSIFQELVYRCFSFEAVAVWSPQKNSENWIEILARRNEWMRTWFQTPSLNYVHLIPEILFSSSGRSRRGTEQELVNSPTLNSPTVNSPTLNSPLSNSSTG